MSVIRGLVFQSLRVQGLEFPTKARLTTRNQCDVGFFGFILVAVFTMRVT